jgi:hypothetical protein
VSHGTVPRLTLETNGLNLFRSAEKIKQLSFDSCLIFFLTSFNVSKINRERFVGLTSNLAEIIFNCMYYIFCHVLIGGGRTIHIFLKCFGVIAAARESN